MYIDIYICTSPWMIPSASARKQVAYVRFKKKGRTWGMEEGWKDADRLMHTHVINTEHPVVARILSGKPWLFIQAIGMKTTKGLWWLKEVMRRLGDAQLVLRPEAFLWLWQTVKTWWGSVNLWLTCVSVYVFVCVLHQLTPVFGLQCIRVSIG